MSSIRKGFVEFIHRKQRPSQKGEGTYTTYNVKIQDPDTGKVDPTWYQFGFAEPANSAGRVMKEGDYVQVSYTTVGDARRVEKGSLRIHPNPPARPANPDKPVDGGKSGGKGGKGSGGGGWADKAPKKSEVFGEIGGYYTEDDIRRITAATALTTAKDVVLGLLQHNALKVSEAQGAAGVVKRYDQILTAIDKLSVKYFNDLASGRQLSAHEDEGTVPGSDTDAEPLPTAEPSAGEDFPDEPPAGDEFPDDEEFE